MSDGTGEGGGAECWSWDCDCGMRAASWYTKSEAEGRIEKHTCEHDTELVERDVLPATESGSDP